jgi:GTP pyrophosphokinase
MTSYPSSKAQIDRLGDRLRQEEESLTESDLRHLDAYRRSFANAYDVVIRTIEGALGLQPTGRPGKSTRSIVDKLQRESIRLVQVQDIAGCRVVVADLVEQDRVVAALATSFEKTTVFDRRIDASYGYRAVHVVANMLGKPVEIQIRTPLQHLWAELSEKLSDVFDPMIKYGYCVEHPETIEWLEQLSDKVTDFEKGEQMIVKLKSMLNMMTTEDIAGLPEETRHTLTATLPVLEESVAERRAAIQQAFGGMLAYMDGSESSEEDA